MIKAKSIMTENVITVNQDATVEAAANLITNKHVNSLLVTINNIPIAVVTKNDLIRGTLTKNPKNIKVKNVMSKKFLIINPDTKYSFLVNELKKRDIKKFPVVDNNKLVGIITETDVVDATRDFTRYHRILQEVIFTIFGLVTAFVLFYFSPLGQSIRKSII